MGCGSSYTHVVLHLPVDDGQKLSEYSVLLLFCNSSKIANSGAFFHADATCDLDLSQGHMQGQLSTITVTPEEDLT